MFGTTVLHAAALRGLKKGVRLLLDAGANIDAEGGLALQTSILQGHEEIAEMLLKAGANVRCQRNPLLAAAARGLKEVVVRLIEAGLDVNMPSNQGTFRVPLQAAAHAGHMAIVKLLLDAGANVNAIDTFGGTALTAAAEIGHNAIVKILLDAGADVNVIDETALKVSGKMGSSDALDAEWYHGSALQIAASRGNEDLAELLLKAGANPNLKLNFKALYPHTVKKSQSLLV